MAFVPAPGIVEVQFRQLLDGQRTMNRIHVDMLGTPVASDILQLIGDCAQWWVDNVAPLVAATCILREVYGKSLETEPGPEATFSAGLPQAGASGSPGLPNNVSLAMSLRSNQTGRSARGRWFWQGFTEDGVVGSLVNSGHVSSIDAALTALKGTIDADGWVWVIVSYNTAGAPRVGGPVYFPVLDVLAVDTVVDSQRRRLPGRGM
jgi:hypothetical protein